MKTVTIEVKGETKKTLDTEKKKVLIKIELHFENDENPFHIRKKIREMENELVYLVRSGGFDFRDIKLLKKGKV